MKFSTLFIIMGSLVLTACEPDKNTANQSSAVVKKYSKATVLAGSVSNNKGVIKTGNINVTDESGKLITQANVENGHYRVEIPAQTVLPVLLNFTSATENEKLLAVVIHENITDYAINPLTTAIAKTAKTMGGYTHAHMTQAAEQTVHVPDENKTSQGWRGDPTTQYGGWH